MDQYTQPVWRRSALLTIDMQEDFSREDAPAYIEGTENIIPDLSELVQFYRDQRWPVIHIVRLYRRDGSNVDNCRRKAVEQGKNIVAPGSDGAELVSELKPDSSVTLDEQQLLESEPQKLASREWALYKSRWGAFYKTGLGRFLQKMNISTVVVAGCNFPNCPRTTIYEASERDYRVVLVKNAVSGLYPRGEEELQNIGISVLSSGEIFADTDKGWN